MYIYIYIYIYPSVERGGPLKDLGRKHLFGVQGCGVWGCGV